MKADQLRAELLAPLEQGRGVRIGCVGLTGSGKSWALRAMVAEAAKSLDVAYVHDDTEDARKWGGQVRVDLADCHARPLLKRSEAGSIVVLTGNPFRRAAADPELSAAEAWSIAERGFKTAVVNDEFRRAVDGQRWREPDGWLPMIYVEGRKPGVSGFWATQFPQEVPRAAARQSELLVFCLDGPDAEYMRRIGVLSDEQAARVTRLCNGEFFVRRLGKPGDLTVYRF